MLSRNDDSKVGCSYVLVEEFLVLYDSNVIVY